MSSMDLVTLEGLTAHQIDALSNAPLAEDILFQATHDFVKRINITLNISTTAEQNASLYEDPFINAGQYGLGWIYFCLVLLALSTVLNIYRSWTDKMRRALHKEIVYQREQAVRKLFQPRPYGLGIGEVMDMETPQSSTSALPLFPVPSGRDSDCNSVTRLPAIPDTDSSLSLPILHKAVALVRYFTYRPTPTFWFGKTMLSFASLNIILIVGAAIVFAALFCFIPQPYFYPSIEDGSPPLAIRSGMIALAMMPWIVAVGMKVNLVSFMTGIGHERLSILHRWGGYICLGLSLCHAVPFYVQPVWTSNTALANYYAAGYFWQTPYVYGSGVAALAPLAFLCLHSLPILRSRLYELFVTLHIPASIAFLAMLFWHTNNTLISWGYLFATVGIWVIALLCRVFFLNWTAFWRRSWLRGEAATVTVLPENAVKVTIPTQVRWKAGQFIYLRIPELSWFENHPFTIAALCDSRLPSAYGPEYRDMIVVFRPFAGFTRKLLHAALKNGPNHIYQACVDGPHGGLQRDLVAFDTVVFVAGGSGITAVISHLLLLVNKMREESAVTKKVFVIWAMKRPESADWFREELRICRQFAPEGAVHCEFYITAAKKCVSTFALPEGYQQNTEMQTVQETELAIHNRVDSVFSGIADKRSSALVREAADGDVEKTQIFAQEATDAVRPLPAAHITPKLKSSAQSAKRPKANLKLTIPKSNRPTPSISSISTSAKETEATKELQSPYSLHLAGFDFGFDQNRGDDDWKEENGRNNVSHVSSFSAMSTAVGSPETAGKDAYGKPKQSFFSPTSTTGGKSPDSSTELTRKFVSPIFYEDAFPQRWQQQQQQEQQHANSDVGYFPPPPSGTMQTGAVQTGAMPQVLSPVIPPPEHSFPFPSVSTQIERTQRPMPGRQHGSNTGATGSTTGWSTEYGRPDIPALLRQFEQEFGKRAAIFVCGPESMRRDVMRETARMQSKVWHSAGQDHGRDEVYLRVESYRL